MGRSAAVVELISDGTDSGALSEAARKIAMHIVASKPQYLQIKDVPTDIMDKEMAIFREQSESDRLKKPAAVFEKIIAGKVNKRLSDICLLEQVCIITQSLHMIDLISVIGLCSG